MKQLLASDIMTHNPIMVKEDQPIAEALAVLKSKGISGAPVLDSDGDLCGLISLKDIAFDALWHEGTNAQGTGYLVQEHSDNAEPIKIPDVLEIDPKLTVSDVMTPMVFTIPADAPLNRIAEDMSKGRVHRLVVVENDKVVGIVSALDLLKVIREC